MAKIKVAFGNSIQSLDQLKNAFKRALDQSGIKYSNVEAKCADGMFVKAEAKSINGKEMETFLQIVSKSMIDSVGDSIENVGIEMQDNKLIVYYWTTDNGDCQ